MLGLVEENQREHQTRSDQHIDDNRERCAKPIKQRTSEGACDQTRSKCGKRPALPQGQQADIGRALKETHDHDPGGEAVKTKADRDRVDRNRHCRDAEPDHLPLAPGQANLPGEESAKPAGKATSSPQCADRQVGGTRMAWPCSHGFNEPPRTGITIG